MTLDARIANLSPAKQRLLERMRSASSVKTYPLSYPQRRLWFISRLEPTSTAYNVVSAFRMNGALDADALDDALEHVVSRHEVLRARFVERDGEAIQQVDPEWQGRLERIDLRNLPAGERDRRVEDVSQRELATPFDLTRGPLLRATLLQTAADRHVFVVALHHIVSDGWSFGILVRDLVRAYGARIGRGSLTLPLPSIQYGDYASWQRQSGQDVTLDAQLAYWRERLAGMERLRLPADRDRPRVRSHDGAGEQLLLDRQFVRALRESSGRAGTTLFMTLLAGFLVVLARWSGQEDIVVGTDVAGRNRQETEGVIGFFINQLVIRARVNSSATVAELLARVKDAVVGALAHQDVPFERVVEKLSPARSLDHAPLFDVKMIMQTIPPRAEGGLQGISVEPLEMQTLRAQTDLLVRVLETGDTAVAYLVYSTDIYETATAQRLLRHWQRVLEQMTADDGRRTRDLDLLDDAERRELLDCAEGPASAQDTGVLLHALIERQATLHPDRVAMLRGDAHVTYRAMDRRANQLAWRLSSLGVGPEVCVGVCVERGPDMVIALAGVLKAGGVYLPLEAEYPEERLAHIIEDSRTAVIVTHTRLRDKLPAVWAQVVELDADQDDESAARTTHPHVDVAATNAAYVLYTSGSTGRPKGIIVSHGSVVNYLRWAAAAYGVDSEWWAPVHTPLGFDLTISSVWLPLSVGGRIELLSEGSGLEGLQSALGRGAGAHTLTKLTPAHLRGLEELPPSDQGSGVLVLGGEALGTAEVSRWREQSHDDRVFNEYGPTEATVGCCVYEVRGLPSSAQVPIGRPIAAARVRVLADGLGLVPKGVAGELCVGGAGLARGYVNRPDLTAEKFVPDPFGRPGDRLYRTGDRARWLPDGNLEYVGRLDDQVKLRGYRIEPGEIEAVLREQRGVADAAVVVRPAAADGPLGLVAYVVASSDAVPARDELLRGLRRRLPEYMVPAVFVELPELPLTVNGKVDRKKLPAPDQVEQRAAEHVPPRGALEEILCGIWEEVLRRERVSADANFFELGGDSILSLQVVARARRAGLQVTVQQIFEEPTVRRLARVLREDEIRSWEPGTGDAPLTPIQRWFFDHNLANPSHWNQAVLLKTPGLRADSLAAAVRLLFAHHDALRLRFERRTDTTWHQLHAAAEPATDHLTCIDLSGIDGRDEQRRVFETCAGHVQGSLNLTHGPVVRVVWFRLAAGEGRLLLVAHHLVVDGVSWRILLEDLPQWYETLAHGRSPLPEPRTAAFGEWARTLAQQVDADWFRRDSEYWAAMSDRVSGWRLAMDLTSADNTSDSVDAVVAELDRDDTRWLLEDLPRYGAHIHELLIAALSRAVAEWNGTDGALLALDGHGRHEFPGSVDVSRTVGWFTVLYPVYVRVDAHEAPHEILRRVRDQLRGVPTNGLGYGLAAWIAGLLPSAARLDQAIAFNYLGQFDQLAWTHGWGMAAERPGSLFARGTRRPHLLEVSGGVRGRRLHMSWSYSRNQFRRDTMQHLADAFVNGLRQVIHSLRDRGELPLAPSAAAAEPSAPSKRRPLLMRQPRPDRLPLSYAQQRVWFLDQLKGSSNEYNIPEALRLNGELDRHALRRALRALVERHEALRTRFVEIDGEPSQVVDHDADIDVPLDDLSGMSRDEQRAFIVSAMRGQWRQPFDLSRGPLLRVRLIKLGEREHVLLRVTHHIVSDLWSQGIFNRELELLYDAYRTGRDNPLPALPVQYADFTLWQRRWLESGMLDDGLAYWRRQLAGIPARLELPTDRPRPALQTFVANTHTTTLPAESIARLRQFNQANQVTLYMTLLTACGVLLSRYTGQDDIVVGTPVANREDVQLENLIGLFMNSVVMRLRVDPVTTGRTLLAQARRATLDAYRYQDVPFERIVEEVSSERTLSATPIYQVLFALQNMPWTPQKMSGLDVLSLPQPEQQVHLDLEILAWDWDGRIGVTWSYNRDLFERWRIEQMARHYVGVLLEIVAAPDRPIAQLSVLTPSERRQLLTEWNLTDRSVLLLTLPALFESQVDAAPDAIALVFEESRLTYGALNARANRLSRRLIARGIGPDDVVALAVPRSLELVTACLAILKAGAAYLPIETGHAAERVAFMCEDARPVCAIATRAVAAWLPVEPTSVLCLDDVEIMRVLEDGDGRNPGDRDRSRPLTAQHLAYVIYTSGSTGRPKGVEITHHGVCNLALAQIEVFGLRPDSAVLQLSSQNFDATVSEWTTALLSGARLVLGSADSLWPGAGLELICRREGVTLATVVPTVLGAWGADDFPTLQTLVVAGEMCPTELVERWTRGRCMRNAYGLTETSVCATISDSLVAGERPRIGRPIWNTQTYVLDQEMQPVPAGVVGNLYIAGDGLARGYVNQPALTASRFLPRPFGDIPGARMYQTGDHARWHPDRSLECLGRVDSQIKLRGCLIEPGEVETALLQRKEIQRAAVVLREDQPGDKRLVAYLVTSGAPPPAESLRLELSGRLPDYMVPSAFVFLDDLPLTQTGKLDRAALQRRDAPVGRERRMRRLYPRDNTETYVKQIWEEILGATDLDVRDNFFSVGGHSMKAAVIAARLTQAYGRRISVAAVIQYPTIEQLAAFLRQDVRFEPRGSIVPIRATGDRPPLFIVHPAAGLASVFVELVQHLGDDQPVYALQSTAYEDHETADLAIEAIAAEYLVDVEKVRSRGPYLLAGWSMGGIVAYEMARQLSKVGKRVDLLAILDQGVEYHLAAAPHPVGTRETVPRPDAAVLSDAQQRRLNGMLSRIKVQAKIPADVTVAQYHAFRRVTARNIRAAKAYRPQLYDGRVTLLSTKLDEVDPTRGWGRLTGDRVDVRAVSGTHEQLVLGTNAAHIAEVLRSVIDETLTTDRA